MVNIGSTKQLWKEPGPPLLVHGVDEHTQTSTNWPAPSRILTVMGRRDQGYIN